MKGNEKMVMFGKKEPLKSKEFEAIPRLEKHEAPRLLEGVMIGSIMCPLVKEIFFD